VAVFVPNGQSLANGVSPSSWKPFWLTTSAWPGRSSEDY
jgi:hypothetical protein